MAREKRAPFDRPAPTDEQLLAALNGGNQRPPASTRSASKITKPAKTYSKPHQALQPSDWVAKACKHCGRDWRTLFNDHANAEQKRQVNGKTQRNVDRAVSDLIVDHPCTEGDEYTRKLRERADKLAAQRIAEEEAAEKALQEQEERDKAAGMRRSRRGRKQEMKLPESEEENED